MTRLFSYKLTHDRGFAPNPFWGFLTLANCKPLIRLSKREGDWIAGFTSKELCNDDVGKERLVFLMEVTEKKPFADYFLSPRFKKKKPNFNKTQCIYRAGDNIYKPTPSQKTYAEFEQLPNPYHNENNKEHDLSGKFVLISERFFYFGSEAISIRPDFRPSLPKGEHPHGVLTHDQAIVKNFINFIVSMWNVGIHGKPHSWPQGDSSWKI